MELTANPTIISCGVGGHYKYGVDRLERSLHFEGWAGKTMLWRDYPSSCPTHAGMGQYNFKLYCFDEAFAAGAKVAVWCDASLWAVSNPMRLFDYVNENGLFFFKSGYSLAETATDYLLAAHKLKREDMFDVPEFATGLVGINIDNPVGRDFYSRWKEYMHAGLFGGNRVHDKADSEHPAFKFSRQDQSAASMALHRMGITSAGENMNFIAYKGTNYDPENIIFFVEGI